MCKRIKSSLKKLERGNETGCFTAWWFQEEAASSLQKAYTLGGDT
jgi:hypothetical protein